VANKQIVSRKGFMTRVSRFVLVFISLISILPIAGSVQPAKGLLKGRVLDQNRAAMPNIKITIENQTNGNQLAVTTDANGEYQVFVDAGRYKMKTFSNSSTLGYERATLNISPGENVIVNFYPSPISIEYAPINEKPSKKFVGRFPQTLILYFPQKEGLYIHDANIEFGSQKCQEGKTFLEATIFTLGRITVFADRCIIDKERAVAIFEGKIEVEENDVIKRAEQLEVDLASGTVNKKR